jgi:hypothetical protein
MRFPNYVERCLVRTESLHWSKTGYSRQLSIGKSSRVMEPSNYAYRYAYACKILAQQTEPNL